MKLSKEQIEALVAWADQTDRANGLGTSGWGRYFDGAMRVAKEVRFNYQQYHQGETGLKCSCGSSHPFAFCPNCGAARHPA